MKSFTLKSVTQKSMSPSYGGGGVASAASGRDGCEYMLRSCEATQTQAHPGRAAAAGWLTSWSYRVVSQAGEYIKRLYFTRSANPEIKDKH